MNGLPYYPRYPRDFFEGTAGMPYELKGAYSLLLDLIYMLGGNLPNDPHYIAGHLGMSVRKVNTVIPRLVEAGKITLEDGIISNKRADNLLIISSKFRDKQAKNRSRPNKNKGLGITKNHHTDTDTDTDTEKKEETPPPPVTVPRDGGGDGRQTDRELILAAIGADPTSGLIGPNGRMLGTPADMAEVALWLDLPHLTIPTITDEIRRIMGLKRDGPPKSFRYFTDAMRRLSGALDQVPLSPIAPPPLQARGPTNDRIAFDHAIRHLADRLDQGSAHIDTASRNPFAIIASK